MGRYIALIFLCLITQAVYGQNEQSKLFDFSTDTIQFDTVSVYSSSVYLYIDGQKVDKANYWIDPITAKLVLKPGINGSKMELKYERMPINLNRDFNHKDPNLIVSDTLQNVEPFKHTVTAQDNSTDLFGSSKLNKQGSISRGVTVGNAQNLSFQSTLNLQLDGQIGPNLYMTGSISDNNIPFQPEGNTQKLQEFDQVKLKIYNDDFAVIGGDFWLYKPKGYFLNYTKRTQGVSIEGYHNWATEKDPIKVTHKLSGAFSRGKFSRNIIQGVEGNQGPYRLTGADNEQFIVVLAGTEKVFIDGQLLKRGQEFDYVIDYNTSEITFTANQLVTKDKRIIVEFQYSDLNYARSLVAYNAEFKGKKFDSWFNIYSEQDAKNQTIQQTLTPEKRAILSVAGDDVSTAFANSIDSIGFYDNRVLYALIDTMGYDSVLVFSVNPDSAIYGATFLYVGDGNGNYVFEQFTANGKVYRWVAPVAGVPQGNYEAVQLLIPPQKKQMVSAGTEYRFNDHMKSSIEVAISNNDVNTFSDLDAGDNQGIAVKWNWGSTHKVGAEERLRLQTRANFEYQHRHFNPIQWFRSVEFDRDWNVRNQPYAGDQILSNAGLNFVIKDFGSIGYDFENFLWGDDYSGIRNNIKSVIVKNGFNAKIDGSWLLSDGIEKTSFLRHNSSISQDIKVLKIGFEDIHEQNEKFLNGDPTLQNTSYRFYDWKAYVSTLDSSKNKFSLYYRERYDWFSDSVRLEQATRAQNIGAEAHFLKYTNNILKVNANYRKLAILDTTLFNSKPENTVLGRLEHVMRLWKGALTTTTFYEIGSGLELKREFIFVEVNTGQGTHTWIDYNNDGVKDLGEFEIAAFQDQGQYIRVFIPTNTYVRTYSNQFNTSIFIRPSRIIKAKEKGFKKLMTRFSDQVVYKVFRKTSYEDNLQAFNPFVYDIVDTSLVSINTSFRNTFYFNKTNSVFGMNYTYQENGSKILLSNGFDTRLHTFHEVRARWNISKYYNIRVNGIIGRKKNSSDYASNRNYYINYHTIEPVISYQPSSSFRISANGKYSEKRNSSDLAETAIIRDVGFDMRFNQKSKGSLNMRANYILISYTGNENSSLAFEMLEALKSGNNFTWGASYQRKVAKNLQLNFNYTGRKSESNKAIHSGGMELRAFF
ncbi:hypothetical protein K6119_10565 [Paracrocinitomix mangrovi]|uniref:hypothetical protein n=1 Tax=Paracrocinitomix mangrovi TaxID=2862509 RepID=UPI001EDC169E|nr:hypothetical protein [Paracrocinitomix mangrovi]UKN00175.1 hypothetical protein K6119_10565 [Paracrocinitomix mangrovi]